MPAVEAEPPSATPVADGAKGEQLYRIGRAVAGFTNHIEENLPKNPALCDLYHFPGDQKTRCQIPVELPDDIQIFFENLGGSRMDMTPNFDIRTGRTRSIHG
jgi:hypothetical protein